MSNTATAPPIIIRAWLGEAEVRGESIRVSRKQLDTLRDLVRAYPGFLVLEGGLDSRKALIYKLRSMGIPIEGRREYGYRLIEPVAIEESFEALSDKERT